MTKLFGQATNGGTNTFSLARNGELQAGGQGVSGKQNLDAGLVAKLFGATLTSGSDVTLAAGGDLNDASISIVQTGAAGVFEALAGVMTGFGNAGQVERGLAEAQGAASIASRFGNLDMALERASIKEENDGDFELQFGGGGVAGTVATNANFATREEAETFLASLRADFDAGPGFKVVVADDDLIGGNFEFSFADKFYRDVNNGKVEDKLEGTDIAFDGSIDSKAEGAAGNLALFLDRLKGDDEFVFEKLEDVGTGTGNVGQVESGRAAAESAERIASKFGDLEMALSRAKIKEENDGDFEIEFVGGGVQGSVATNGDFATEARAQQFLDSLIAVQDGLLDDALF